MAPSAPRKYELVPKQRVVGRQCDRRLERAASIVGEQLDRDLASNISHDLEISRLDQVQRGPSVCDALLCIGACVSYLRVSRIGPTRRTETSGAC